MTAAASHRSRATPVPLTSLFWSALLVPTLVYTGCAGPAGELSVTADTDPLTARVGQEVSTTLILQNSGEGELVLGDITYYEPPIPEGPQFSVDPPAADTHLAAGESATLTVTFTPLVIGETWLDLEIASSGGTRTITLQATGENNPPEVTFNQPLQVCLGVPLTVSGSVTDVEDADQLDLIAATLESSAEGGIAGGFFDAAGQFSTEATFHSAGTQALTLNAIDTVGDMGSSSVTIVVDDTDANGDGAPDCSDQDQDGYSATDGDCNDQDAAINPAAADVCSGIDENCDGEIDPLPASDQDGDGTSDCTDDDDDGVTEQGGDCNDQDAEVHPDAAETCNNVDDNCDGATDEGFDADGDGHFPLDCTRGDDCDDSDGDVNPGASEACNLIDDNCDGTIDEGFDTDGDTFSSCGGDCNDGDAAIHPGVTEDCDGIDQDCDGTIDNGFDTDADGYTSCQVGPAAGDCNDDDAAIHPGATELCNLADDDCDGAVDEEAAFDGDSDGFTSCGGDCNDADAAVRPDATEACNDVDDDCDGSTDEGFDADGDGYESLALCATGTDCDDTEADVNPGAAEACNELDDNCDGSTDEGFDQDRDGFDSCAGDCDDTNGSVNPNATEVCDGRDNDCNEQIDETDQDGDGYVPLACNPGGPGDCNDFNDEVNPDATEVCNLIDDDCDGTADEDFDEDGDGYATCTGDCDDDNVDIHPIIDDSGWVEYPCNPVLANTPIDDDADREDAYMTDQASIMVDWNAPEAERYKAWYRFSTSSSDKRTIAYAVSPDGVTWSKQGEVLDIGATGKFDEKYLNFPSVLYHDGKYRMWYHGINSANKVQIGYATSDDGIHWDRQNNGDSVLSYSSSSSDFDNNTVQSPSVLWVDHEDGSGEYYMWYCGSDTNNVFQIGLATSSDGINWTKQGLVLARGLSGDWDSGRVNFTRVLFNGEFYEMFYSSGTTSLTTAFGYASSPDGYTWTKYATPILTAAGDATWKQGLIYSPSTLISTDLEDRRIYTMWFGGGPSSSGPFQTGIATNIKPDIQIVAPYTGTSFTTDDIILFQAYVEDPWHRIIDDADTGEQTMDISILLESDLQGILASGNVGADGYATFETSLSPGTHTISMVARDIGGLETIDQIVISVQQ